MLVKRDLFRVLALGSIIVLACVDCTPAVNPNSYSATATVPTFTVLPLTPTVGLAIAWSATPDINATAGYVVPSLPPPQSYAATSTPEWLTPPSPTFTPSDIPTTTIIFDTPQPGQIQGIRGTVLMGGGPANEYGTPASPGPLSGYRVFVLDSATKQVVAEAISSSSPDSYGRYEIRLLPGRYDLCIHAYAELCEYYGVIIIAGQFVDLDLAIPE